MAAGAQSPAFGFWSEWKANHFPRKLVPILLFALTFLGLLVLKWWRLDRQDHERRRTVIIAMLVIGTVLEFFVSASFDANGNAKHLFIFNCMVDVILVLAGVDIIATGLSAWANVRRRISSAG